MPSNTTRAWSRRAIGKSPHKGGNSVKISRAGNPVGLRRRLRAIFPLGKYMAKRSPTPAEIGDVIRATRKAAGLRQDELAGAAGVGLRFVVDLEAGKTTAQIGKALQVLSALGCSIDITPPPQPDERRKP